MITPGPTDRAGAHRLSLKVAERFVELGYPCLRFDPRGAGESEGDWGAEYEGKPILDVYNEVEQGVWVPDTLAAIQHLMDKTGVSSIVLGGTCGGAITALLAGADLDKVTGLFLVGNPVTLSSVALLNTSWFPDQRLEDESNRYLRRMWQPSAWLKFITLKADYKTLREVFVARIRRRLPGARRAKQKVAESLLSPQFVEAFATAIKCGKRMLFVYATNDHHWQEFNQYFVETRPEKELRAMDIVSIQDANHNLTEDPWQDQLFTALASWIGAVASGRYTF